MFQNNHLDLVTAAAPALASPPPQHPFYASPDALAMQNSDPLNPEYQLGSILLDKYRLDSVLGEGSFAVVFGASALSSSASALSSSTKCYGRSKVAVKCLYKTGLSRSQLLLQREEVLLLKRVASHPNITSLLDICETKHHLYLVLEYCDLDLFDGIIKSPFAETKALDLFEELVSAVASCHEVGVYHRDLKPENILLTSKEDPHVRLTDFGLATTDSLSTEFGCGSVRYMSPECMSSSSSSSSSYTANFSATTTPVNSPFASPTSSITSSTTNNKNNNTHLQKQKKSAANKGTPYLSAANDVWSLAIILINMLTGKNPWVEPSVKDKHFRTHLINQQASVDSFQSQFNFSHGFCQVLRLVFSSSPQDRPSAREFLSHVKRLPSLFAPASSRTTLSSRYATTTSPKKQSQQPTISVPSNAKNAITANTPISPSSFTTTATTAVSCRTAAASQAQAPINVVLPPKINKHAIPPTPELESPWPTMTNHQQPTHTKQLYTSSMMPARHNTGSPPMSAASYSSRQEEEEDVLLFEMEEDHVMA